MEFFVGLPSHISTVLHCQDMLSQNKLFALSDWKMTFVSGLTPLHHNKGVSVVFNTTSHVARFGTKNHKHTPSPIYFLQLFISVDAPSTSRKISKQVRIELHDPAKIIVWMLTPTEIRCSLFCPVRMQSCWRKRKRGEWAQLVLSAHHARGISLNYQAPRERI